MHFDLLSIPNCCAAPTPHSKGGQWNICSAAGSRRDIPLCPQPEGEGFTWKSFCSIHFSLQQLSRAKYRNDTHMSCLLHSGKFPSFFSLPMSAPVLCQTAELILHLSKCKPRGGSLPSQIHYKTSADLTHMGWWIFWCLLLSLHNSNRRRWLSRPPQFQLTQPSACSKILSWLNWYCTGIYLGILSIWSS